MSGRMRMVTIWPLLGMTVLLFGMEARGPHDLPMPRGYWGPPASIPNSTTHWPGRCSANIWLERISGQHGKMMGNERTIFSWNKIFSPFCAAVVTPSQSPTAFFQTFSNDPNVLFSAKLISVINCDSPSYFRPLMLRSSFLPSCISSLSFATPPCAHCETWRLEECW